MKSMVVAVVLGWSLKVDEVDGGGGHSKLMKLMVVAVTQN